MVQADSTDSWPAQPRKGAGIPVASMVESVVGCKWSVLLLGLIADGSCRPSVLLRTCPGLSTKVMNERLRKMIRFGIVHRSVFGEKPPIEVEYRLTPFGRRFMGILAEVRRLQEAVDRGSVSDAEETEERSPEDDRPTRSGS